MNAKRRCACMLLVRGRVWISAGYVKNWTIYYSILLPLMQGED